MNANSATHDPSRRDEIFRTPRPRTRWFSAIGCAVALSACWSSQLGAQVVSQSTLVSAGQAASLLGSTIDAVGDVNGDGVPDFIVGDDATSGVAAARLISGATGQTIRMFGGPPSQLFYKRSVANIGDINGDGIPDVAIGEPSSLGVPANGQVVVYSGATGATLRVIYGAAFTAGFGYRVISASDLDGDGVTDMLVTAPGTVAPIAAGLLNPFFSGNSSVVAFSGATGATLYVVAAPVASQSFGYSIASVGDIDLDGRPDFVVGVPNQTIVGGGIVSEARIYSGATGALIRVLANAGLDESFGTALAGIGDIDGDGIPDVIVGVPRFASTTPSLANIGRVEARSGATGNIIWTRLGSFAGTQFGQFITTVPDLTGDGIPDVVASAPASGSSAVAPTVRVQLLSGATGTPVAGIALPLGTALRSIGDLNGDSVPDVAIGDSGGIDGGTIVVISGATAAPVLGISGDSHADRFGSSLADIGDVNGDGIADFAIGAPRANAGALVDAGRVEVRSGATNALLYARTGSTPMSGFGFCLANIGDVNSDGVPDWIVGAPSAMTAGGMTGSASVISGATGATLLTLAGPAGTSWFGYAVARIGDEDGDGVPDYAIGAPLAAAGTNVAAGLVEIHSGATGSTIRTLTVASPSTFFGASIAGIGDVDGDGFPDIAVGAPQNPNGLYPPSLGYQLLPQISNGNGYVTVFSGATGAQLWTANGIYVGAGFGGAVAGIGDVSGDGVPDVIAGPTANPYYARVFSGLNGALIRSHQEAGSFGTAVAGIGDVTGDGIPDYMVASPNTTLTILGPSQATIYSGATGIPYAALTTPTGNTSALARLGPATLGGATRIAVGCPDSLTGTAGQGWGSVSVLGLAPNVSPVITIGTGCPIPGNIPQPPFIGITGGAPTASGNPNFAIRMALATPGAAAAIVAGTSATNWMGIPLPWNLTSLGFAGCSVFVAADFVFPVTINNQLFGPIYGGALLPIPIPANPANIGVTVYFQGVVMSPTPTITQLGGFTSGLKVTVVP